MFTENIFFHPNIHKKVRVFDKSWHHVGLIMSNYELTERWEQNQCQHESPRSL